MKKEVNKNLTLQITFPIIELKTTINLKNNCFYKLTVFYLTKHNRSKFKNTLKAFEGSGGMPIAGPVIWSCMMRD